MIDVQRCGPIQMEEPVLIFSAFFPDHKSINHIKTLCDSCKSYSDTVRFRIKKINSSESALILRLTDADALCMVEMRHEPFRQVNQLGNFDTMIKINTLVSAFDQIKKLKTHCYLKGYSNRSLVVIHGDTRIPVELCNYRRRFIGKLDSNKFVQDHKPNVEVIFPHQDFDVMLGLMAKQAGNDGGIVDLEVYKRNIKLELVSRMGNDIHFDIQTKHTDLTYGIVDPIAERIRVSFFLRYARRLHMFFHKYPKSKSLFIVHSKKGKDDKLEGGVLFDVSVLGHTQILCWIAHIPDHERETYG